MPAGPLDIIIEPGADFELVLQCSDETGAPVDLAQIKNLVPNPSFESAAPWPEWALYTNSGTSVVAQASGPSPRSGSYVAQVTGSGMAADSISMLIYGGDPNRTKIKPGQRAFVRGSMRHVSGTLDSSSRMAIEVRWLRGNGGYNGEADLLGTDRIINPPVTGTWYDLFGVSPPAPPGTGAVGMGFWLYNPSSSGPHAPVFVADAAMVIADVAVDFETPYFDGSTATLAATRCDWTGTPHNSPSVCGPYTAAAQVRARYDTGDVALPFDVDLGTGGVITVSADAADTEALPARLRRGVWDLELADTSTGDVIRLLQGKVQINPQVTQ